MKMERQLDDESFNASSYSCIGWMTYQKEQNNDTTTTYKALTHLSEHPPKPYSDVYQIITSRVVVAICAFGLIGNLCAFFLLVHRRNASRRSSQRVGESRSAQSDISCFIALSVSDLCFCAVLIPQYFRDINVTLYDRRSFLMFYELYEDAVVNTCVLSSTWLTVSMTVNRYLHLSHPMWTLRHTRRHQVLVAIIGAMLLSVTFNLPRFWLRGVTRTDCLFPRNTTLYYVTDSDRTWRPAYHWTYFGVGIVLPLCVLAYSNARIIIAVCRSIAITKRNSERNLITKTLICVVFFYVCLVSPAELIKFFEVHYTGDPDLILVASAVANLLQAINFSCNFIPYLILDKTVRNNVIQGGRGAQRRLSSFSMTTFARAANGSLYDGMTDPAKRALARNSNGKHKSSQFIRMYSQQSMSTDFTRTSGRQMSITSCPPK